MHYFSKKLMIPALVACLLLCSCAPAAVPEPAESAPPETASTEPMELPDTPATGIPELEPTMEPTPTLTPEPDPILELIEGMTLREKVCQMLIVGTATVDKKTVTGISEQYASALQDLPVGGFNLTKNNIKSEQQLREFIEGLQAASDIPLIITITQEGGRVDRLGSALGKKTLKAMLSYADEGSAKAFENAETLASLMADLGFNLDLAPVADVWSDPDNTVIGDRAYSTDFAQAAELIPEAVKGFHAGGLGCTLKHFPGHGNTKEDSHKASAYVIKSLDELRVEDFLPFAAGIEAGADAVMLGHLIVPEISDEPIVFSREMIEEILRDELGFEGVVMTDALNMKALTAHYSQAEIAVRAIGAGVDILLLPKSPAETVEALISAVEDGTLSETRIDESVYRVLQMKESLGLF